MNCALPCICHSHEIYPQPDRGMGIYLILFYSYGSCGHNVSCPYLAILFIFALQIIVYNTTKKFQNLPTSLQYPTKVYTNKTTSS